MQEYKTLEIDVSDDTKLSDVLERLLTKVSLKRTDDPMKWKVTFPYRDLVNLKPKERLELIVYLMWYFRLTLDAGEAIKGAKTDKTPSYTV